MNAAHEEWGAANLQRAILAGAGAPSAAIPGSEEVRIGTQAGGVSAIIARGRPKSARKNARLMVNG